MPSDYQLAQLIHVLAASVWIGGHIVILVGYVPRLLASGSFRELEAFERVYEKIGLPSLVIAALTGIYMALKISSPSEWLSTREPGVLVAVKILLVAATVALALDARMRIIRQYRATGRINKWDMALHIAGVTLIAVLFAVVGWMIRY